MTIVALIVSVIAVLSIGDYWFETGFMEHPCRSSDLIFGEWTKTVGTIAFWLAVLLWIGVKAQNENKTE